MLQLKQIDADLVDSYELRGLVGFGGTSLVFAAVDLSLKRLVGQERKVALKFVWDAARAREEVQRLVRLDGQGSVNSLLAYLEVPFSRIGELLADGLATRRERTGETLDFEPDRIFGVLVLQFAHGQNIVRTEHLLERTRLRKGEWLIEIDGEPFVQSLATKLTLEERIALIRGLIKVVKGAHDRTPPQVHGDLHPGNVVFERVSGDLVVIDWSGDGVYGADGWISPWHDLLFLGELTALPEAADIYLLALWIERLLAQEYPGWRPMVQAVMAQKEGGLDGSIHDFSQTFEEVALHATQKKYRRTVYVIAAVALVVIGVVVWIFFNRMKISERREQVEDMVTQALNNETRSEHTLITLKSYLTDPLYATIKQDIIKGIGQIKLKYNNSAPFLQSMNLAQPNCVYISDDQSFVVYKQFPFSLGASVSDNEFISDIQARGIQILDQRTSKRREIKFLEHPLLADNGKNQLIIYESDLYDVIASLSELTDKEFFFMPSGRPIIYGLIRGATPIELRERVIGCSVDMSTWNHSLKIENEFVWIRCLDLATGTRIKGSLSTNIYNYLVTDLGFEVESFPAEIKEAQLSFILNEPRDCVELFQELSIKNGFKMVRSKDGHRFRFEYLGKDKIR